MSEKKVATEFVTQHFCDMCGMMISDGSWNGGGGINFWGQYLHMKKANIHEIKIETKPFSFSQGVLLDISFGFDNEYFKELCIKCSNEVKEFIERRAVENDSTKPSNQSIP